MKSKVRYCYKKEILIEWVKKSNGRVGDWYAWYEYLRDIGRCIGMQNRHKDIKYGMKRYQVWYEEISSMV